ncbi:8-amino-7-oxononanoate synthase [Alteromonas australica]|nr:8-amino-7-oxononanoate synthase [Alteromonas australica]
MAFDWLEPALQARAEQGYFRQRHCQQYEKDNIVCINNKHYLNFASNDYLGMRHHDGVLQNWVEGLAQFGAGSGASALVTGHSQAHLALEAYLAEGLNREAALLFNSGYAANQALCFALANASTEGVSIFADRLMHASFLEAANESKAMLRRFAHNDKTHLQTLLKKPVSGDKLIVTEGIFSMDGDSAPTHDLVAIAKAHDAWLMLDDAHGMGVLGERGLGTVEAAGLTQDHVPIVMGTFGKAIGTAGAFIAGSQALIDFLVNFAKHYIYSTAMPSGQAVATLASLTYIASDSSRRDTLYDNISHFRKGIERAFGQNAGVDEGSGLMTQSTPITLKASNSAIQPLIVGSPQKALALSEGLKTRGIWVPAIRYPTVPKGEDRLRITLSATHNKQDIDVLIDALSLAIEDRS